MTLGLILAWCPFASRSSTRWQNLRQSRLVRFLFSSSGVGPAYSGENFRGAIIRFITVVALIFFSAFGLSKILSDGVTAEGLTWYGLILALGVSVLLALHRKRVRFAGRLMVLSLVLILVDPTMTYWSPGTAVFSLIFTLLFQLILEHTRDIVIAVGMNMVVYTYVVFASPGTSPLPANDYFSNPVSALLTMYVAHMILIGIAYFIRREQQKRDEVRLLVEQQRADILRQILTYASHDLRTPLTKIGLKLHLLEVKSDDPRAQDDIAALKEFVGELESLVLSMLEMASLDSLEEFTPTRVNPDLMIVDVLSLYAASAKQKRLVLRHQSDMVDAEINVDDVYFRRALCNVLENAIAHTPEEGRIDIRVSHSREHVHIEIKDTGEGIAEEHLPFIFDRFYRADAARNQETGRNGLGLAIARKIIELHGGSISVHSEVGVGSTFTITLPLVNPS